MDTIYWILLLIGALAAWSAVLGTLKARGVLKEPTFKVPALYTKKDPSGNVVFEVPGPMLTIETKAFHNIIEAAARPKLFWKAAITLGLAVVALFVVGTFVLVVLGAVLMLVVPMTAEQVAVNHVISQPQNILVIPGVNQLVPLWYGWLALLAAVIVHEGGHAILARAEGIKLRSVGVMLIGCLPIAFFADIDEEELFGVVKAPSGNDYTVPEARKAGYWPFMRIISAGVIMNMLAFVVTFALMGWLLGQVVPDSAEYAAPLNDLDSFWYLFLLPINQFADGATGFSIFAGEAAQHYSIVGPAEFLGPGMVFVLIQALFWIWWLNINLAFTNCIPIIPLDGGHILNDTMRVVAAKLLGDENKAKTVAGYFVGAISVIALLALAATYVLAAFSKVGP